jgi:hypothetical protein
MNDYWNRRYATGGTSGRGSNAWKWEAIKRALGNINMPIIDVGCGDMSFWGTEKLPTGYIGIDGSDVITKANIARYPKSDFICAPSGEPLKISAPVVFCFEMLYHIMDDEEYRNTIYNLCDYSSDYLLIYTWVDNPIRKFGIFKAECSKYEKYRHPKEMCAIIRGRGFSLVSSDRCEYPNQHGAMFVFRKIPR